MATMFGWSKSTNKPFGDTHHMPDTNADRSRQSIYDLVVSTVQSQTSPAQSPVCTQRELHTTLVAHADVGRGDVSTAVRAAVDNDDLLTLQDPRDGRPLILPADPDTLVRVHEWLRDLEAETQPEHAWLNQVLAEVRDGD